MLRRLLLWAARAVPLPVEFVSVRRCQFAINAEQSGKRVAAVCFNAKQSGWRQPVHGYK